MKFFKIALIFLGGLVIVLPATAYVYLYVLPKGPALTAPSVTPEGKASFVMRAHDGAQHRTIRVWTFKPSNWRNGGDVLFVMHGMSRNAEAYLDTWVEIAEREAVLLIAPEFENPFYQYVTNDYQDGNLYTALGFANPQSEWAYTTIERVVDTLNDRNDWSITSYDMFGHSAGGQFVQKMAMLAPSSRLRTGVAANPGTYVFPDPEVDFPYGLKDIRPSSVDLATAFSRDVVVLIGEQDADTNQGVLDESAAAMRQGPHRLARGRNFYATASNLAEKRGLPFNWHLQVVPDVGHENQKVATVAAILLGYGERGERADVAAQKPTGQPPERPS